jgi:hypothetical protein
MVEHSLVAKADAVNEACLVEIHLPKTSKIMPEEVQDRAARELLHPTRERLQQSWQRIF